MGEHEAVVGSLTPRRGSKSYVDRILKGAKTKAFGLDIPPTLLARADEVIE
jgi:hypothetical protein